MKYSIHVLYKDYHNKEVVLLGVIPTNLKMDTQSCLARARSVFGSLVKDPNCIYAFQTNGRSEWK